MKTSTDYKSRFRILKGGKIALVISAMIGATTISFGAPSGESIVSGNISINRDTPNTTNINQSTNKGIINWQNFDVSKNETVNFNQPNRFSSTLNRVLSNNPSNIYGQINSNGQVFLVNQNGIYFGKNSSVNTAGFTASTLDIKNNNFLNEKYTFEGNSNASILNLGTITSNNAYTALLAKEVINEGLIQATLGNVQLASGEKISFNINGNSLVKLTIDKGTLNSLVQNKGLIQANGGVVYLTTKALDTVLNGVVNNSGVIEANSIEQKDGKIILFAHGGTANIDGALTAKDGFIETSGKELHVKASTTVKAHTWLLDPTNLVVESSGGTNLTGSSVSATAIQNALVGTNVELQADEDITVNENITWADATKLTLTAGDEVYVNKTIQNTNSTNGGVYFNASNTTDKVIFGVDGKVIINNIHQLQWVNTALNGNYELGSNVDATDTKTWNGGAGFNPLGSFYRMFTGNFDGQGNSISNLYINKPVTNYVGLFGFLDTGSSISNLGLINVDITGNSHVGGLASYMYRGTISNSYTTGSVSGNDTVGGLVSVNAGDIFNSYANVNVAGTSTVGGLVGDNGGTIFNSYAIGSVSGTSTTGGLVGDNGGIAINSYWDIQTSGQATSAAGIGKTTNEMKNPNTYLGWDTNIWNLLKAQAEGYGVTGLPYLENVTQVSDRPHREILFENGFGTSANPYGITNWEQLDNIRDVVGNNFYFNLLNNIDSSTINYNTYASSSANSGLGWNPIGYYDSADLSKRFTGNFDGKNHTISNLYINRPTATVPNPVGLFGYGFVAIISNLGLVDVDIIGNNRVGGLSGTIYSGTISNVHVTGNVSGNDDVGGLIGTTNGTVNNSYSNASVNGNYKVGGLVGYIAHSGSIKNSYATGNVNGTNVIGGLVGLFDIGSILNSYATGTINGTSSVGGLVGSTSFTHGTMENSYATGTVSGNDKVGGLVGSNSVQIFNSYATGTVSGNDKVGGLVGKNNRIVAGIPESITNSYAIGSVNGNSRVGGLIGFKAGIGVITNSFWDKETSGQAISAGGTGKTTAQMKDGNTYTGWDTNVWDLAGTHTEGYGIGLAYLKNVTQVSDRPSRETLFENGFGNSANPYGITNWEQLDNIRDVLTNNFYFNLLKNIGSSTSDYNTYASNTANTNLGWNPLGDSTTRFLGNFDGKNYAISNLYINRPSTNNIGLFGYTDMSASISNLGLVDVNIKGDRNTGGLVGRNDGMLSNSYSTGTINGGSNVGGLVGQNDVNNGRISNSYSTVTVTGTGNDVGGLVGDNYGTISNVYSTGRVIGDSRFGGLVGNDSGVVFDSFWDTQTSGQALSAAGTGKTTAQMKDGNIYTGWDTNIWDLTGTHTEGYGIGLAYLKNVTRLEDRPSREVLFENGFGTDVNPYGITNWKQLDNIKDVLTNNFYFNLLNNVNSSTSDYNTYASSSANTNFGWNPLGDSTTRFLGNFDGKNYAISNLYINRPSTDYVGLFGYTDTGSSISNLGLVNVDIKGRDEVGGLVGRNKGNIFNTYGTGTVTGRRYIGGLVSFNDSGSISNSYSRTSVSSSSNFRVGGLVSTNQGGTVSHSYSTGAVTGDNGAGGLIGGGSGGTIEYSFWDIETSGQTNSAGGQGRTTAQMKDTRTFFDLGWDFDTIWGRDTQNVENNGYLGLRSLTNFAFNTVVGMTVDDQSKVYDGTADITTTLSKTNVIDNVTAFTKNVGSNIFTSSMNDYGLTYASGYNNSNTEVLIYNSGSQTITPKALSLSNITASDKVYDGTTDAIVSATLTGLITGDDVSISSTFDNKNVGTGKTVTLNSLVGTDKDNYFTTLGQTTTADITKKVLVVAPTPTLVSRNIVNSILRDAKNKDMFTENNNPMGAFENKKQLRFAKIFQNLLNTQEAK